MIGRHSRVLVVLAAAMLSGCYHRSTVRPTQSCPAAPTCWYETHGDGFIVRRCAP